MKGNMRKKGGAFGGWKKKHAVLEESTFNVYSNEKVGSIDFNLTPQTSELLFSFFFFLDEES